MLKRLVDWVKYEVLGRPRPPVKFDLDLSSALSNLIGALFARQEMILTRATTPQGQDEMIGETDVQELPMLFIGPELPPNYVAGYPNGSMFQVTNEKEVTSVKYNPEVISADSGLCVRVDRADWDIERFSYSAPKPTGTDQERSTTDQERPTDE